MARVASHRTPRTATTILAAVAVGGSYLAVRTGAAARADLFARRRLGRPGPRALDRLVGLVTDVGSVYGLAGVATALATSGHRRLGRDVAVAGGIAWTAAQAAKPALDRRRPYEADGAARLVALPAGSSWPSGHVAVTAAMATVLWGGAPPLVRAALLATTGEVAMSRIYVGVHHLSDVVAGAGIGVLSTAAARRLVTGRHRSGDTAERSGVPAS